MEKKLESTLGFQAYGKGLGVLGFRGLKRERLSILFPSLGFGV